MARTTENQEMTLLRVLEKVYVSARAVVELLLFDSYPVFETGRAGPALTSLGPACGLYIKPGRPPLARAFQERSLAGLQARAGRVIGRDSCPRVAPTH